MSGAVKLLSESVVSFGAQFSSSELELISDDFVMENSTLLVYGALRLTANTLSLRKSMIDIVASSDEMLVAASAVEASNLAYLRVSVLLSFSDFLVALGDDIYIHTGYWLCL